MAKGELTEDEKACIEEIDATVERYAARKKEIEESYVEAGLELPLTSRNLNASVYPIGVSFEPVGRDYRKALIEETNARNAETAKAYEETEAPDTDDIDQLNADVREMTQQLMDIETRIAEANINDDADALVTLRQESEKVRSRRDNTINKIKALKVEGARSASASGVSKEFQDKILNQEQQISSLRTQMGMLRSDVYEMKDMLAEIMFRLGIQRNDDRED